MNVNSPHPLARMPDHPLHQPNDHFFKSIFASPANAAAFLQHHLPADITRLIPCQSVSIENSSLLDPALSNLHSDLLLRVPFSPSNDAFLIVLLEHQSAPDPRLPLRILRYILRVLERFSRDANSPRDLPPIIPFLVSQSDRPWSGPLTLRELLKIPQGLEHVLLPYQIQLNIHVLDLFNTPYQDLHGTPDGVLALRALKAKPLGDLLSDDVWDSSVLEHVSTDALTSFLLYTLDAEDDPDAVLHRTHQFHSNAMHTARMSAAQKLIEQGRSEGIREGIIEGKREGILEGKRAGLREGKREGERGGITASLLQNLQIRFGPIPDSIHSQLSSITSLERLMNLLSLSIQCRSLDAFRESLSLTDSN